MSFRKIYEQILDLKKESRKNLIFKKGEFVLDMNFRMTALNLFALFIWTY